MNQNSIVKIKNEINLLATELFYTFFKEIKKI